MLDDSSEVSDADNHMEVRFDIDVLELVDVDRDGCLQWLL
jgi:hypothetical protein